jgi:3-oxoacyl-[acyl-carrier-protein] synthase-1
MASLYVKAGGLVTPVGGTFETSCAAIRAGIRNVTTANIFDQRSGAFIDAGQVALHQWWESSEIIPDLVAPAIQECFEAGAGTSSPDEIPIFLGLAGRDRKGRPPGIDISILNAVAQRLKFKLHPSSRVIFESQVSACLGLREARQLFETGAADSCIVAGVDTLVRRMTVYAYLEDSRILTPENSNGFSPGEAGGALLIQAKPGQSQLEILGLGFARESATVDSGEPLRAVGLTDAVRNALHDAGIEMTEVSYRITDLNGERYKFKEASFVLGRLLKKRVPQDLELWHPTEYVGEIGAAIGPLALAIALHAGQEGYAPGDVVLLHFSNDGGERGAIIGRFVTGD